MLKGLKHVDFKELLFVCNVKRYQTLKCLLFNLSLETLDAGTIDLVNNNKKPRKKQ